MSDLNVVSWLRKNNDENSSNDVLSVPLLHKSNFGCFL